ncbi:MAG: 4Fe-4S ferredoxin [Deltaproteobacteria bacterium HGW-Deltaproteobacteria-19]|jgi:flavodoxin/NAD-dependent dihydropyrimidine dehydrogenase PreA subunit|nr:MAG: 4Fe-4S ferredoxin [Deltaproteobacteria bacterium HGW-Deltaproteobacteria-19]
MKLLLNYFSATGNTAKIAKVLEEAFAAAGAEVDLHDITPYSRRREKIELKPYQAVVFGAPIHSWRAPRLVREWMRTLDGQGKKCSMFFSYGGFGVHPTHYSTRKILEEQGFIVVSSAEFPASHTFNIGGWRAMAGRPDVTDFAAAKEYAERTYKRFTGEDPAVTGEFEKTDYTEETLDAIEAFRFKVLTQLPGRGGDDCSMCMICEELCPSGAMNAEPGEADKEKCIACLGCVHNCPDSVLKINDMSQGWALKLQMEQITEDEMRKKKSRIYL